MATSKLFRTSALLAAVTLAMALLVLTNLQGKAARAQERPNIVFILTDDQPADTLKQMPVLKTRLMGEGVTFKNAVVTNPLCCPSRATLQRGQYSHNHNVLTNSAPRGAWPRFDALDLERSTVTTWLDGAGYRTGHFGKYMNEYNTRRIPPGWDGWFTRVGAHRDGRVNDNGTLRTLRGHLDSAAKARAVGWVEDSAPRDTPFYLQLGLFAPHKPGDYAQKYADDFPDARVPHDPSFDEADVSDKPAYVRRQPRLTQAETNDLDALYRNQLRSLMTVDEAIRDITDALRSAGELHNTYIVFYTDNGLHLGHHRFLNGKNTPYRTDTRFPVIMRGPGIPANSRSYELASSNDLAPTLARMGGARVPGFVDGRSLLPVADGDPPANWRTALLSYHWRSDAPLQPGKKPEWWALMTGQRTYVEYETGERELYDLAADPYELENLLYNQKPEAEVGAAELSTRLDTLKNCAGAACRKAENGPLVPSP